MAQAVEKIEQFPETRGALTPMDMLEKAVASGQGIEVIGKLMDFQERWDRMQARKAFDEAIANAKAEIPVINKNREVDFTSQKGRTHYRYEDLSEVARVVTPILAKHGLSYRFRTSSPLNEPVTVTCIISHRAGHFEENPLSAGRDESGNKNSIQAMSSTITYLQRITLKAALGLAAGDDDDGKSAPSEPAITEEQVMTLRDSIESNGAVPEAFCKIFKIEKISALPAARYGEAIKRLEEYGRQQRGGK